MSNNYSEQIFQSIDTIISQRLNEVSFDKTEICEIISQDENNKQKYWVTNGSLKFEAYSIDENRNYTKENQKVYVTIPQGNYALRKLIIGSYSADETNENLYVNPFNHLVTSSSHEVSDIIITTNTSGNSTSNFKDLNIRFNYSNPIDFDYIGLEFGLDTSSLQGTYKGTYSIELQIYNNEDEQLNTSRIILYNTDLYGNPYSLIPMLKFQHLFPFPKEIKKITDIAKIRVLLAQDGNFEKIGNIKLQDIKLYFGYDTKTITKDELQLILEEGQSLKYTTGETAAAAERILYLDWKHFDTFNNPYIFNINQKPNIFEEYSVYWLHYVDGLGENVDLPDEYAWNWETINFIGLETNQYLTKLINLTTQFRTDQYKVVIKYTTNKFTEEQQNNIIIFNKLKSEYKQLLLDLKNPNLTEEEKTKKKIRLEEIQKSKELVNSYYTYTESTGLVFDNTDVAADPGASNSSEDSLRIKLDEGDTGVYNIYGLDGRMMDYSYKGRPHNIHFEFLDTTPLDRIASIKWEFPSENTMIKDVADIDKQQATFNIDTMYKPGAMNNRIWCTVTLVTGEIRRGSLTLQFGEASAAGSNYAFNIDFIGHRTCLYATGKEDSVEIQAIFTKQNGEVMTVPTITWSWMNDYNSPITLSSSAGEKITLTYNNSEVPEENYSILQAKINDYAIDNGLTTNLTAYLPIPIAKPEYNYISGATRVVYDSNGNTATYSRNPYELYNLTNKITNTSWDIISNSTNDAFQLKTQNIRDKNGNIIGEEKTLLPLSYIPQEPPMTCIYCILNGNIVWSQPILIMQNRWEYDLLNEWNGKLNINDQQGYILAPLLGAGKKEGNEFTGVMMGDLKLANGSVTNTGLYGFKEGSRRFSFNDKGEAYIGTGDYYIDFNGENLIIKAKNFDLNTDKLKINSDNGIELLNSSNETVIKLNNNGTATIGGWNIEENGLYFDGNYSTARIGLSSTGDWAIWTGYNTATKTAPFYVTKDGILHATGADIEGTLKTDIANITGTITAKRIDVTGVISAGSADIQGIVKATEISADKITTGTLNAKLISGTNSNTVTFNGNITVTGNATFYGNIKSGATIGAKGLKILDSDDHTLLSRDNGKIYFDNGSIIGISSTAWIDIAATGFDNNNLGNDGIRLSGRRIYISGINSNTSINPTKYYLQRWYSSTNKNHFEIHADNDAYLDLNVGADNIRLWCDYSGGKLKGTWTAENLTSDKKVKHNIETLNDQYEILFDCLQPKRYKYNFGTSNRFHTGFVAQEVVSAIESSGLTTQDFAAVIFATNDPDYPDGIWSLRRDEFISLNTWQIQKLKARVTELEKEIKEIKQNEI